MYSACPSPITTRLQRTTTERNIKSKPKHAFQGTKHDKWQRECLLRLLAAALALGETSPMCSIATQMQRSIMTDRCLLRCTPAQLPRAAGRQSPRPFLRALRTSFSELAACIAAVAPVCVANILLPAAARELPLPARRSQLKTLRSESRMVRR